MHRREGVVLETIHCSAQNAALFVDLKKISFVVTYCYPCVELVLFLVILLFICFKIIIFFVFFHRDRFLFFFLNQNIMLFKSYSRVGIFCFQTKIATIPSYIIELNGLLKTSKSFNKSIIQMKLLS